EEGADGDGRAAVVYAEDGVLGEVEVEQKAAPVAVFGHVCDAQFVALARAGTRDVVPLELHRAADLRRRHESGERLDKLRLAVTLDSGDADDLAGAHFKRNVAHAAAAARRDREVAHAQDGL